MLTIKLLGEMSFAVDGNQVPSLLLAELAYREGDPDEAWVYFRKSLEQLAKHIKKEPAVLPDTKEVAQILRNKLLE